ncbi:RNA ligase [Dasychira pudibunda nucleopolyhedrovirus]|nr:RNA ligase [Dasychira pudibunda nucleopolyhedrovirus]WHM28356.1 RNA ligase [Dasychira pudibunda nucleopolyhedrovirus]
MVYIKIDTGSRAKGYANEQSDYDYQVFTKCDRETFMEFGFNNHLLKCKHGKDNDGNDVRHMDLNVALYKVYTGQAADLGIFLQQNDCKDKYGQENVQLFRFIKKLTAVSMVKIVNKLLKYQGSASAKKLLLLMFNYAFTEYYLDFKRMPASNKILNILLNVDDSVDLTTRGPSHLLVNGQEVPIAQNVPIEVSDELTIVMKKVDNVKMFAELMQRGDYREEWGEFFKSWAQELKGRLAHIPEPPKRADVLHSIYMYALNERGPVMPEDESDVLCQIYPSVSHLDRQKKGALANKQILVQEKLDGCNYRVIVNKGAVTFGSRNTYRPDTEFLNVHRISARLKDCAFKLMTLMGADSFVVYGELLGWKNDAKIKPINEIEYSDQRESLKYYAYEIQFAGGAFVPFEEAQLRLRSAGFDTIPHHKCLFNDFVKNLHFISQMFPNSPLEGYIIRCGKLIYKLKSDYKDVHMLQIEPGPFDALNCDELNEECAVGGKLDFLNVLRHCHKKFVCDTKNEKQLFNKLYYLYRKRFNFDHKDYKTMYTEYRNSVCNK